MPSQFDKGLVAQIGAIRAIGRSRLTDAGELEDFVQETLLRAYTRRDQLGDVERLPQWVHAIARNTAINWNRNRRYLPVLSDAVGDSTDGGEDACARMQAEERFRALRSALMALAPRDREMLVAHVVDGVAYGDLRTRYGLSSSAVGVRLHRAKRRLRQRLGAMVVAAAYGVGLGARQAMGAMIVTARWKTALLVGAAAGGTIAVGVWQVTQPGADAPPLDDRAESVTTTRSPGSRRQRVTTPVDRAGRSASPTAGRGADSRLPRESSDTAAAPSTSTAATPAPSVRPEPPAVAAPDATASGAADSTLGGGGARGELALVVGQIVGRHGGTLQLRLEDGTAARITTPSGNPFPEGAIGGTVSFEVAPPSEQ